MVLKSGFQLTALGVAVGVVLSLIVARFATSFSSLLFGTKPTDAGDFWGCNRNHYYCFSAGMLYPCVPGFEGGPHDCPTVRIRLLS